MNYYFLLAKYYFDLLIMIIEGYWSLLSIKLGFKKYDKLAVERKTLCYSCPVRSKLLGISYCDGNKGGCGCVISAKSLVPRAECPFDVWDFLLSDKADNSRFIRQYYAENQDQKLDFLTVLKVEKKLKESIKQ